VLLVFQLETETVSHQHCTNFLKTKQKNFPLLQQLGNWSKHAQHIQEATKKKAGSRAGRYTNIIVAPQYKPGTAETMFHDLLDDIIIK